MKPTQLSIALTLSLLLLLPFIHADSLNVSLISPINTTNSSVGYLTFNVSANVTSTTFGSFNITNASIFIQNTTPLQAGVSAVNWGVNTSNVTIVANSSPGFAWILVNVSGLSSGKYVWNANLTVSNNTPSSISNFSSSNFTFAVDNSTPTAMYANLLDQGANDQMLFYPNMTFPLMLGNTFIKPIAGFVTFGIQAIDSANVSGIQGVSIMTNGAQGSLVNGVLANGNILNGTWNVTFNIINIADGFANFTVNITTFAGDSFVFNVTGNNTANTNVSENYLDVINNDNNSNNPMFTNIPTRGALYYVNNWPLIQGTIRDEYSGMTYNNSSPSIYNASIVVTKSVMPGLNQNPFQQSYPVDSNGNFFADIKDPAAPSTPLVIITEWNSGNVTIVYDSNYSELANYTNFHGPKGATFDADGNAWVAESGSNDVVKFNPYNGTILANISTGITPNDIAIDPNNNIWVSSQGSNTVYEINAFTDSIVKTFSGFSNNLAIASDSNGNIWVTNYNSNYLSEINYATGLVSNYGGFNGSKGLAVDQNGNIWVANYLGNTVSEVNSSNGVILANVTTASTNPAFVAVDQNNNVWVTDYHNSLIPGMVSEINADSLNSIANYTVGINPYGLGVDSLGNIWVVNSGNFSAEILNSTNGAEIGNVPISQYSYTLGDITGFQRENFVRKPFPTSSFQTFPAIYSYQAQVVGPNGIVSRASSSSNPKPIGFMAPPGMPETGITLYVVPSEVLNLQVTNATGNCTRFFGMIADSVTNSIVRNFQNVSNNSPSCSNSFVQTILPANKNYTLVVGNPPNNGALVPPISIPLTTQNLSNYNFTGYNGNLTNVTINGSFGPAIFNGSLMIYNSTSGSNVTCSYNSSTGIIDQNCANFTGLEVFPIVNNFIPSMGPAVSENSSWLQNVSDNSNNPNPVFYNTSNFNVSVLGSSYNVDYLAIGFATINGTNFMGEYQFTANTNSPVTANITLYQQPGNASVFNYNPNLPVSGMTGLNTSGTVFQFVNSSDSLLNSTGNNGGSNFMVMLDTNYSGIAVNFQYNVQSGSSSVQVPLIDNQPVTLQVFGPGFEPVSDTISGALIHSNGTINIVITPPEITGAFSGGQQNFSTSNTLTTVKTSFLVSNSTCNAPNFPQSCVLSFLSQNGKNASNFNSNDISLSGILNELITETDTNTSILLEGIDMATSSTPNMELNPATQSSNGNNLLAKTLVGSLVPHEDIAGIWVGSPLQNSSGVNLNQVTVSIPALYDDFGNIEWNASVNTTSQVPSAYSDYVSSFSGQASNASDLSGISCYTNYNSSIRCWIDNSTSVPEVWLQLPHFSSVQLQVQAPSTSSSSPSATSSGGSSSGSSWCFGSQCTTPASTTVTILNNSTQNSSSSQSQSNISENTSNSSNEEYSSQKAISQLQSEIEIAQSSGIDVSALQPLLVKAEQAQSSGNYAQAMLYAEQAQALLTQAAPVAAPTTLTYPSSVPSQNSYSFPYLPVGLLFVIVLVAAYFYLKKPK